MTDDAARGSGQVGGGRGSLAPLRRPVIGLAVCAAAGTLMAAACPWSPAPVLAAGLLLALLAWLLAHRRFSSALCFAAAVLAAWGNAGMSFRDPSGRSPARLLTRPREQVAVIGVVAGDPVVTPGRREGQEIREFPFRIEGLRRTEEWQRARGVLEARWAGPASGLRPDYGQRWALPGLLSVAAGTAAPAGHAGTLDVIPVGAEPLAEGRGSRLVSWCLRGRRACSVILGRGIESYREETGLLRALMLGYRQEMSDRLYRAFSTTGTLHVVAISGMHVAVMSMLFIALLRALGLSRQYWVLWLAPLLVAYTIATGLRPSALRAAVMAGVFWAAPLFRRRPDGPAALAVAGLLIVAAVPAQLFDLGFLFSFAAVAGLMVFYSRWMRPVNARLGRDAWQAQSPPAWKEWPRAAALGAASVLVASMAACLATAPLAARCFNMVSPIALVGNLLVIPLSSLVLLTGVLSLAAGWCCPFLAEVFNHAGRVFLHLMLEWVDGLSGIPGGFVFVQAPSMPWVLAWYLALVAWLSARKLARVVLAAAFVAVVGAAVCRWAADDRVAVDVLDVGQGNAVLVNVPGPRDILVDAGPRWTARRVARHLRRQGVDRLRAVVLTHGDADHAGGAAELLRTVPTEELWCGPFVTASSACREALDEARRLGTRIRRLARGDQGFLGGGVEWEVLHPSGAARSFRRGDEASLVLRVAAGANAVLLMGGADATVEKALLRAPVEVRAAVLVAGNHAAPGTCTEEWVRAVAPEHAVISVGADNEDGHPSRRALETLARQGAAVHRTDEAGDVRIVFSVGAGGGSCAVATSPPRPARRGAVGIPGRS